MSPGILSSKEKRTGSYPICSSSKAIIFAIPSFSTHSGTATRKLARGPLPCCSAIMVVLCLVAFQCTIQFLLTGFPREMEYVRDMTSSERFPKIPAENVAVRLLGSKLYRIIPTFQFQEIVCRLHVSQGFAGSAAEGTTKT